METDMIYENVEERNAVIKHKGITRRIYKKLLMWQQRDMLTGLYNRSYLIKVIEEYIKNYKISSVKFSVILVDIQRFKLINNSLGRGVGDSLLVEIARRLADIYGKGLLFKVDGGRFIILRKNMNKEALTSFSDSLLSSLNQPYFIGDVINVNFSIGISMFPDDGLTAENLLRYASLAVYSSGKLNTDIVFYSEEILKESEEKFYIANNICNAIHKNEMYIHYQPILSIKDNEIVGAEALLRWNSPLLGNIPPSKFIPFIEKTGLIIEIGEWVIDNVCAQIIKWKQNSVNVVPISINVSVRQLEQVNFADKFINKLHTSNIEPSLIEIEITESVSIVSIEKVMENISELRKNNIKISIDDFGTGNSTFEQFDIIEMDRLKIDKVFIDNIELELKKQDIIKSILSMANNQNIAVVIEGIETHEQLDLLKNFGCEYGQGFLWSKPVAAEEIEKLLSLKN